MDGMELPVLFDTGYSARQPLFHKVYNFLLLRADATEPGERQKDTISERPRSLTTFLGK